MKKNIRILFIGVLLVMWSCKNDLQTIENRVEKTTSALSQEEKKEIVTYYLINSRKLSEEDFHEIQFINDNVKVIHYEGRDAFFSFRFSEALEFYTKSNQLPL